MLHFYESLIQHRGKVSLSIFKGTTSCFLLVPARSRDYVALPLQTSQRHLKQVTRASKQFFWFSSVSPKCASSRSYFYQDISPNSFNPCQNCLILEILGETTVKVSLTPILTFPIDCQGQTTCLLQGKAIWAHRGRYHISDL